MKRDKRRPVTAVPASNGRTARRMWLASLALLVVSGLAVYANTWHAPFVFDGRSRIVDHPDIRTVWPPSVSMADNSRPLVYWSFALNYAYGGLYVEGFHAVNIAIHILAALVLWGIVRRTLELPALAARFGRAAPALALVIALIWLVHPLQTQSVTYIYQRFESLMGLFFLLTLYCFIRAVSTSGARWPWYVVSVVCCCLGAGCKEVIAAAPLLVLAYDWLFVAGGWREILSQRKAYYAGLMASWCLVGYLLLSVASKLEAAGLVTVENLTPQTYALSQFGVLLQYLKLCFWPVHQCFDYAWPVAKTWHDVLPGLLVVGALALATLIGALRGWRPAYLGLWFFLILAPTSSIMPIADIAVEHRMYLPLAAVICATVLALYSLAVRIYRPEPLPQIAKIGFVAASSLVVLALSQLTLARNADYATEVALWEHTCRERPDNARAFTNLGVGLAEIHQYSAANKAFDVALEMQPDSYDVHYNAGRMLAAQSQWTEAVRHFEESLRLKPGQPRAIGSLGQVYQQLGRNDAAERLYRDAIAADPHAVDAHTYLANLLIRSGKLGAAAEELEQALQLAPSNAQAHYQLANIQADLNQVDGALEHYRTAIRLDPSLAKAHFKLGVLLLSQQQIERAVAPLQTAVKLDPANEQARLALAAARRQLEAAE